MAGLRKPPGAPSPSPRPRNERAEPESGATEAPKATETTETTETTEVPKATQTTEAPETAATVEPVAEVDALTGEPDTAKPRPSPRRKARDEGVVKPSSEAEVDTAKDERQESAGRGAAKDSSSARAVSLTGAGRSLSGRSLKPVVAGLLVVAVLFAGLAVFFRIQGAEAQSATNNTALVDVARTAQVKEQTAAAVEQLFSYDYNDIAKTENAAKELLVTDEVREQYEKQFAEVKRVAPEQKMVVTTKVTRSGVMMLDDDRAKVLLFVDQTSTRTDKNQTSSGGSQLSVDAELRDGTWKITRLNTYNDLPQPAEDGDTPEGGN